MNGERRKAVRAIVVCGGVFFLHVFVASIVTCNEQAPACHPLIKKAALPTLLVNAAFFLVTMAL
jgi:cell shape-determining protein MreD